MTLSSFFKGLFWYIFKFKDDKEDLDKVVKQLDEPYKVQTFFNFCIKYTSDENTLDHWQSAERTFERRRGDCEDFAIFADKCLGDGLFLCMYDQDSGHATYLLCGDDEYTSIGTFGLMKHKVDKNKNFNENVASWLKSWGYKDWTSFRFTDVNGKTLKRIYRSEIDVN